jgi:hypothetical protein
MFKQTHLMGFDPAEDSAHLRHISTSCPAIFPNGYCCKVVHRMITERICHSYGSVRVLHQITQVSAFGSSEERTCAVRYLYGIFQLKAENKIE